tara:strand:- start:1587 stop:2855 length:1269 start_codon:yes stop_codon:yes gene_type:complete
MNIAIIGSGGREHSLCFKLKKSKKVSKIFCFPGNAGTSSISKNIKVDTNNFSKIFKHIKKNKINLIVVGPEVPLVNGIVDYFKKRNIPIFGPSKKASKLEGSKVFMKNFCKKFKIPTAKYKQVFNLDDAKHFISTLKFPIVVKSDGLAAGKGVTICKNKKKALLEIKKIFNGKFKSSRKVVVEEFLAGEEASYFVITDGKSFKNIGTAQDHKRIGEGDTGPNTGGMGAYSPSYIINKKMENKIINKIIIPTINGMRKIGCRYQGILYAGLMINNNEPKLIEYNVRFGDPECQVIMMRLKNDLLELIQSTLNKNLKKKRIVWERKKAITVVVANKGYPGKYKNNIELKNLYKIKQNSKMQLFHAGTIIDERNKVKTNGGRVLNATVMNQNLKVARDTAHKMIKRIVWKNKYYRKDIGYKVIDK